MADTDVLIMALPVEGTRGWATDVNSNFTILDDKTIVCRLWSGETIKQVGAGQVVVLGAADDTVLKSTTENDPDVVGVCWDEPLTPQASGLVAVTGYVEVLYVTGTVSRGDYLCTSDVEGFARKAAWYEAKFARALSDKDGSGRVSAVLFQPQGFPWGSMVCYFDVGLFDFHLFGV